MPVKTYNLKDVIASVSGVPVEGGADGDKIKIEFASERFTKQVGADGEVTRSEQNNNTGKITFSLMYGSDLNDYFDSLRVSKLVVPILVRDTRGRSNYFSPSSWIEKEPDETFGKDAGNRDWVFDCADIDRTHGGLTPSFT